MSQQSFPVRSMTAFARQQVEMPWGACTWEIRSVNHRYLETHFKLPDSLKALEPQLREAVRNALARGKVDIHLNFKQSQTEQSVTINAEKLKELLAIARQVQRIADTQSELSMQQMLSWQGVIEQAEVDVEDLAPDLIASFSQALNQLIEAREREGERLAQLIEERLAQITGLVAQAKTRIPEILQEHRQRIEARVAELSIEVDADRLTQEIALLAQKVDVAEELDRLLAHVAEVRSTLQKAEPCGRRLDFLMQELNREANTLGSKSIAIDTSNNAVDLKVLIEQMREQVQNIE